MRHIAKTLIMMAAATAAGQTHADIARFTFVTGAASPTDSYIGNLRGGGVLTFSESLIGALEVAGIQTSAVAPATVDIATDDDGTRISAAAPVLTVSGTYSTDGHVIEVEQVRTMGGAMMAAPKNDFAPTAGSLSLTGITVDLTTKSIFADLTGGNGVGVREDVHVWNYANIEGPTTFNLASNTTLASINKLTGLVITEEAFNLFAQSLGLTSGGKAAMREITDYGVMDAQISLDVKNLPPTPAVPEPATYLLMGLGLVGMGFASRRARRG